MEGATVGTKFGAVVYATRIYAARSHCPVVSETEMAILPTLALTAPVGFSGHTVCGSCLNQLLMRQARCPFCRVSVFQGEVKLHRWRLC